VYIAFGGEQRLSLVNEAAINTLKALMEAGYNGALAIHVRTWMVTKHLSTILSDEKLRKWLENLPEIRTFTADLNAKKLVFSRVKINDKTITTPYREALLTDEHVSLLNKSTPPPEQLNPPPIETTKTFFLFDSSLFRRTPPKRRLAHPTFQLILL